MNTIKYKESKLKSHLPGLVQLAESMRRSPEEPMDVSLAEVMEDFDGDEHGINLPEGGLTMSALYEDLGVDPSFDTISNLFTLPDTSIRWLVPEIIRDALRLGLRKAPIYPNLIAAQQTIKSLQATVPWWNMSDAKMKWVGEGETITKGSVSIGSKNITIRKMGRGISITDEVKNYCSINIVSLFMQDLGVKMGQGLDTLAIETLINGEAGNTGTESAPVIGVATGGTLLYKDLLTIWVRMGRIGRSPNAIIGGEQAAIDTLNMTQFSQTGRLYGAPVTGINMKTPIPTTTDYYVHGLVAANQQIIVDTSSALIKYDAQPLLVETERIISNQTTATFATMTTGFAIMMRDARVILDSANSKGADGAAYGWPAYMNPVSQEITVID